MTFILHDMGHEVLQALALSVLEVAQTFVHILVSTSDFHWQFLFSFISVPDNYQLVMHLSMKLDQVLLYQGNLIDMHDGVLLVEYSDVGMTFLPTTVRLVYQMIQMMPTYEAVDEGVGHHGNVVPNILKEIMDTCLIFTGNKKQEANKVSPA